jgi:hypothetical protein
MRSLLLVCALCLSCVVDGGNRRSVSFVDADYSADQAWVCLPDGGAGLKCVTLERFLAAAAESGLIQPPPDMPASTQL